MPLRAALVADLQTMLGDRDNRSHLCVHVSALIFRMEIMGRRKNSDDS